MNDTYYICEECGNVIPVADATGGVPECCGAPMVETQANIDGAPEKHLPSVKIVDGELLVNVGEADHPMIDVHYIPWVHVITDEGSMTVRLNPGDDPHADFDLEGATPKQVFSFCTVHGLWVLNL